MRGTSNVYHVRLFPSSVMNDMRPMKFARSLPAPLLSSYAAFQSHFETAAKPCTEGTDRPTLVEHLALYVLSVSAQAYGLKTHDHQHILQQVAQDFGVDMTELYAAVTKKDRAISAAGMKV
ncbi:hypothetical protein JCM11641_008348 [Rhodosporidiobolus odoratus]